MGLFDTLHEAADYIIDDLLEDRNVGEVIDNKLVVEAVAGLLKAAHASNYIGDDQDKAKGIKWKNIAKKYIVNRSIIKDEE